MWHSPCSAHGSSAGNWWDRSVLVGHEPRIIAPYRSWQGLFRLSATPGPPCSLCRRRVVVCISRSIHAEAAILRYLFLRTANLPSVPIELTSRKAEQHGSHAVLDVLLSLQQDWLGRWVRSNTAALHMLIGALDARCADSKIVTQPLEAETWRVSRSTAFRLTHRLPDRW